MAACQSVCQTPVSEHDTFRIFQLRPLSSHPLRSSVFNASFADAHNVPPQTPDATSHSLCTQRLWPNTHRSDTAELVNFGRHRHAARAKRTKRPSRPFLARPLTNGADNHSPSGQNVLAAQDQEHLERQGIFLAVGIFGTYRTSRREYTTKAFGLPQFASVRTHAHQPDGRALLTCPPPARRNATNAVPDQNSRRGVHRDHAPDYRGIEANQRPIWSRMARYQLGPRSGLRRMALSKIGTLVAK